MHHLVYAVYAISSLDTSFPLKHRAKTQRQDGASFHAARQRSDVRTTKQGQVLARRLPLANGHVLWGARLAHGELCSCGSDAVTAVCSGVRSALLGKPDCLRQWLLSRAMDWSLASWTWRMRLAGMRCECYCNKRRAYAAHMLPDRRIRRRPGSRDCSRD